MARLTIVMSDEEYEQLCLLAQLALRSPSNQALYLLRRALGLGAAEKDAGEKKERKE